MARAGRNLFTGFSLDAPYVTETRRILQTLGRRTQDSGQRVFMVTSAARGEGKSTICALLSIVAAKALGRNTLLIDADLRRPTIHHLLGMSPRPGLFEFLEGRVSFDTAMRPTLLPKLSVISSGAHPARPGEAYRDETFAALVKRVRGAFDLVFIDSAPVVPVVEPLLMAEHVDGVIAVVMAGKTPVPIVRRMRDILTPAAQKLVGVIVNNASSQLPYYYDYRYYGYPGQEAHSRRARQGPTIHSDSHPSGSRAYKL